FDPCTAISADDINGIMGSDFDEGASNDMSGIAMCTFGDMSSGQSVVVQWAPTPGTLDDALTAMDSLYDDLDDPEPVTVAGADEAAVITGTISEVDASVLIATADGGFLQVVSTAHDISSDQAVQIAETTFAGICPDPEPAGTPAGEHLAQGRRRDVRRRPSACSGRSPGCVPRHPLPAVRCSRSHPLPLGGRAADGR